MDEIIHQGQAMRQSMRRFRRSLMLASAAPLVAGAVAYWQWPRIRENFAHETKQVASTTIQADEVQERFKATVVKVAKDPDVQATVKDLVRQQTTLLLQDPAIQDMFVQQLKRAVLQVMNDEEVRARMKEKSAEAISSTDAKEAVVRVMRDDKVQKDAGKFIQGAILSAIHLK
jgi:hypothetical protein